MSPVADPECSAGPQIMAEEPGVYRNAYGDLIEAWKVNLITRRAKQRGWRGADLEDAQQVLILELLEFTFDPAKSHGAAETTALVAVIDRRLAMLRRGERRHAARIERLKSSLGPSGGEACSDVPRINLALDVREAVEDLPPLAQKICGALAEGQSVSEIARRLGIRWRAARAQMDSIRGYFAYLGLAPPAKTRAAGQEVV